MLETPFGKINILVDGVAIHYEAKPFDYIKPPVKDKPIAGCYRIHITAENHRSIQCVLELENEKVEVSSSSGERYVCKEFEYGTTMLAIGVEDENPAFELERLENGMEYRMKSPVEEVVFGIAWATDYEGTDDVRVWFAADPTVYFKTASEQDVVMKNLEKVLSEKISDLKANEIVRCETEMYEEIYIDRTEKDNSKWLALMTKALRGAKSFEIHCWNEENEWIDLALKYGNLKESDWKYGKIIAGNVTKEFSDMILSMPKPQDIEIYNKMTPFFSIFLDEFNFQSCHYGTEIYVEERRL